MADHQILIDLEMDEFYLEDVPGLRYEDKDLSDEDICKKYGLVMPKE